MRDTGHRWRVAMFTLTYASIDGWSPKHITRFIKTTREHLRRRGWMMRYVWVLEMQKRGAPHYHVLIWLPRGVTLPKPDKSGSWPHGLTRSEWARNAVGYIAKYAAKSEQRRELPRGARVCAVGGLDKARAAIRRWWLAPCWVRERWPIGANIFPAREGGGWVDRSTGEWCPSPFLCCFINGALSIMRRE
jgi:hypothetical protein